MEWVLPLRHELLTPLFLFLTTLGDTLFYLVALAVAYWLGDRTTFRRLALLVTLTAILNSFLKGVFAVPRPDGISWLAEADGYSFPSGHAQTAAVAWLWLALEFRRRWLTASAIFLILGIAASRVYLGVHTLVDVAAGILIGAATVALAWRPAHQSLALWEKTPPALRLLLWALALAALFATTDLVADHVAVVGAGALMGFQVGYLLEKDRGAPLHPGWRKAAALILGLAVALAIRILGKQLFAIVGLPPEAGDFLRYFLIALWVLWLAPRTFSALRLAPR